MTKEELATEEGKHSIGFHIEKTNKRELKEGEQYPTYEFSTIQEMFDALTPDNVESFCKEFSTAIQASVHMREIIYHTAVDLAKKDGKDISDLKPSDCMKMPSFKWIDD